MIHFIFLIVLFFLIPSINRHAPFYIFSFSILLLMLVLRYDYGNDYLSYFNIYQSIQKGAGIYNDIEPLYYIWNLYAPSFYLIIALISLFYIVTIFVFIRENLKFNEYWMAVLIWLINPYLFLIHLSSLRQTIAICIFLCATYFIVKRSFFGYALMIILAMNFHISAVALLPLYFVINDKKVTLKQIIFIFSGIAILILTPLIDIIINSVLPYFPGNYTYYYDNDTGNSLRATLLSSVYLIVIGCNLHKLKGKELIYGKLSLIATTLSVLAFKISMLTRIGMYFDIFLIVTIPMILNKIDNKIIKVLIFLLIFTIYVLRYYAFFTNPMYSDHYIKYKSILEIDFP